MSETLTTSAAAVQMSTRTFETDTSTVVAVSTAQPTVWALLGTAGMLFAGFASAYLVRREGLDWVRLRLPGILWVNSIVLLASSATIEAARHADRHGQSRDVKRWVGASATLGLAFLLGQYAAWRQLAAQGVYLPSSAYASFFYMLTAVHGVHLLGGMLALGYLLWHVSRATGDAIRATTLSGCAAYWHFVDAVWVFLYLLLLFY